MSRFNQKTQITSATPLPDAVNLAGGKAYAKSPELALVSLLSTSMLNGKGFYEKDEAALKNLGELVNEVDPKFAAKAAIYIRNEQGLRSITHAMAAFIAPRASGTTWGTNFYDKIVRRVDDMTEITSALWNLTSTKKGLVPHAMKKGFKRAMNRYEEYHLAKYRGGTKEVKLIDLVNLVRPGRAEKFKKLMTDTLPSADTWETAISAAGPDETKKASEWKRLIMDGKLGFFALLRNVNNLVEACGNDSEVMGNLCAQLTDADDIRRSLIFPFQFGKAIRAVEAKGAGHRVKAALFEALDISVGNVPKLVGDSVVVLDTSGSMGESENPESPFGIGALFAASMVKALGCRFMIFHSNAKFMPLNTRNSVWDIYREIVAKRENGGTNHHSIYEPLMAARLDAARLFILSDEQGWMKSTTPQAVAEQWAQMCCKVKPTIYSWNLNASDTTQFKQSEKIDVMMLSGWSDKVFDLIKAAEQDPAQMLGVIEAIEL